MNWTRRRTHLVTFAAWLLGTCVWAALHIHSILTEDPRVSWGEPYVYTFSFQLFAFISSWLPRSLVFTLLPTLLAEAAAFEVFRWSRQRGYCNSGMQRTSARRDV